MEASSHGVSKLLEIQGLQEKMVDAIRLELLCIEKVGITCYDDDGKFRLRRLGLEEECDSRLSAEPDVGYQEINPLGIENLQRLFRTRRCEHSVMFSLQEVFECGEDIPVIIDHEYFTMHNSD